MDKSSDKKTREECEIDVSQLPKIILKFSGESLTLYQGCWYMSSSVPNIISFQKNFQPKDKDIIFASNPKSGTTWMKALLFSIINRNLYTPSKTPLLTSNPHDLVPTLEFDILSNPRKYDIDNIASPRLFATHMAYVSLPKHVISKSRIVYICRNPLDTIVSFWHFVPQYMLYNDPHWTLDVYVDAFCKGISALGPFWDHVLGFWKASLENPERVLFLRYEDLIEDTTSYVKKVAEFVGFPFSEGEEKLGLVEQIVEICSIKNLKNLDVNKNGKLAADRKSRCNSFFRKGEVGDWINHLNPSMVEKVNKVVEEKLRGSGLAFKYKL